jgi:hypothetical protein
MSPETRGEREPQVQSITFKQAAENAYVLASLTPGTIPDRMNSVFSRVADGLFINSTVRSLVSNLPAGYRLADACTTVLKAENDREEAAGQMSVEQLASSEEIESVGRTEISMMLDTACTVLATSFFELEWKKKVDGFVDSLLQHGSSNLDEEGLLYAHSMVDLHDSDKIIALENEGRLLSGIKSIRNPSYYQDLATRICDTLTGNSDNSRLDLYKRVRTASILFTGQEMERVFVAASQSASLKDRKRISAEMRRFSSTFMDEEGRFIEPNNLSVEYTLQLFRSVKFIKNLIETSPQNTLEHLKPALDFVKNIDSQSYNVGLLIAPVTEQDKMDTLAADEFSSVNLHEELTPDQIERQEETKKRLEEERKHEQATKASIRDSLNEFEGRQAELLSSWDISSKKLKKLGFSELQHQLVTGLKNSDGEQILAGISKDEARELIGYFLRLADIGSEELYDTLGHEEDIFSTLKAEIESIGANAQLPNGKIAHPIRLIIQVITEDWSSYQQIIAGSCPKNGAEMVRAIEARLFPEAQNNQVQDNENGLKPIEEIIESTPNIPGGEHDYAAIAEQLDQVILPPNPTKADVEEAIERLDEETGEESQQIDWDRLRNLATISEHFDGRLFRAKKESLGGAPTYFVVLFSTENDLYAIAETPATGNATYIVAESMSAGSCLEVLELPKQDAREAGAKRIIHREIDGKTITEYHMEKILNAVKELETIERKAAA